MLRQVLLGISRTLPGKYKQRVACLPIAGSWIRGLYANMLSLEGGVFRTQAGLASGLFWSIGRNIGRDQMEGTFEKHVQEHLHSLVQPGWVIYDIGANVGFFTLFMARLSGETGRVFAFEPNRAVLPDLMQNIRVNSFSWAAAVPLALSDRAGEVLFEVAPLHSTSKIVKSKSAKATSVPSTTVDSLVYEQEYPPPHLLKIDVEGAEVDVLKGAREVLCRARPRILCETHSSELEQGVVALLREHGYDFSFLPSVGRMTIWPRHLAATPRTAAGAQ